MKYDFSGWATRANVKCSDGRTIMPDAFSGNNGGTVPLVWNHQHNEAFNVLGHALLENRKEGVYAYCTFNDTEQGQNAKLLVEHGDVSALSIYANQLRQNAKKEVFHGVIREVSLVLAGANPEAHIDNVIAHSDDDDDNFSAEIYTGNDFTLSHADESEPKKEETEVAEEKKPEQKEKTAEDIINELNEEQKTVVHSLIRRALEISRQDDDEAAHNDEDETEEETMKHNMFDKETEQNEDVLSHAEMKAIFDDGNRYGLLSKSVLAHGIENIDYLFPEAKTVTPGLEFIKRDTGWVGKVLGSVGHSAFSRIKSIFADITEDDARALGYIKGKYKKEEVFSLLKRSTGPQTIYKKQKLDRDDIIDITDFDIVASVKTEMRGMLDEEIARAILISDGRSTASDDKIREDCIRPVAYDEDLFTIKVNVQVAANTDDQDKAKAFIKSIIKARKNYKGSGSPTLYATEDIITDCLLIENGIGELQYDMAKLEKTLRVKEIVTVPVMEGVKGKNGGELLGVLVNLVDYKVGADKGGAVSLFDDFDIDYNAQKYLIETRCSGALIKPYSAMAIEMSVAAGA